MKSNTTLQMMAALTVLMSAPMLQADTFGSGGNTFTIDFVDIGNAGNAPDNSGYGSVSYNYRIGTYEVSRGMIESFNAVSGYTPMTMSDMSASGGNGANQPATGVSWNEAARFVNWLNTSQGYQAAYKIKSPLEDANARHTLWQSADAWQAGGENLYRHKDAHYFLPNEDEWYKAAYYDPSGPGYYNYATGSDSAPDGLDSSGDTVFDAVFNDGYDQGGPNEITNAGILSAYGTMGQNGNVWERLETSLDGTNDDILTDDPRVVRSGDWANPTSFLDVTHRHGDVPNQENYNVGFRVASIDPVPEPSSISLLALGAAGLVFRRKRN